MASRGDDGTCATRRRLLSVMPWRMSLEARRAIYSATNWAQRLERTGDIRREGRRRGLVRPKMQSVAPLEAGVAGPPLDGPPTVQAGPPMDGPLADGPLADGPLADGPLTDDPLTEPVDPQRTTRTDGRPTDGRPTDGAGRPTDGRPTDGARADPPMNGRRAVTPVPIAAVGKRVLIGRPQTLPTGGQRPKAALPTVIGRPRKALPTGKPTTEGGSTDGDRPTSTADGSERPTPEFRGRVSR